MGGEAEVVTTMGERGIEQQSEDHREVNKQEKKRKKRLQLFYNDIKKIPTHQSF